MGAKRFLPSHPVLIGLLCAIIFARINGQDPPDPCNPVDVCATGELGDKVKDPLDCHNYYICISSGTDIVPSDNPLTCDAGDYFDETVGECTKEEGPCSNMCLNRDCGSVCLEDTGVIAYPNDCSKYIVCLPGQTAVVDCLPEAPYFDGEICGTDPYRCCDICTPYCEVAYTEVMDPQDCTAYYLCLYEGPYVPSEEEHFSCNDGEYFDSVTGFCTPNTEEKCESLCNSTTTLF